MIRLFYNYYKDKHQARQLEIDYCMQMNLCNRLLTVEVVESPGKPTYDFFFQKINEITGPDDINIICNSDIFFDHTIGLVPGAMQDERKRIFALSRWDWHTPTHSTLFDREDSQDTWIVKGKVIGVNGNFTLGIRGCDNRIANEFHRAGYIVTNPSKTIKTYHVHNSGVRNYTMHDVVPPPYKTIKPTEL